MSEPTLFSRFSNKNRLVEVALDCCTTHFTAFGTDLLEQGIEGREWFGKMIDHQIEKKEETFFLLNYAHSLDRGSEPKEDGSSFRSVVTEAGRKLLRRYDFKSDEEIFVYFSGIARMILYTTAYIVNGLWPNTEEIRDEVYTVSMGGLNSFLEKKVVS